jgi:hypothetical protein
MAVIAVYLVVSLTVVLWARSWARKRSFSPVRAGWLAALLMYLLVAWEQIPTYLVHKFLCVTKAGLHVYVTPEQWDKENPGAFDELVFTNEGSKSEKLPGGTTRRYKTSRLVWDVSHNKIPLLPVRIHEYSVTDLTTDRILAESIAISSGYGSLGVGGDSSWKIWVGTDSCGPRIGEEMNLYRDYWEDRE